MKPIGAAALVLVAAAILIAGCGQNLSSSSAPYNSGRAASGTERFGRAAGPSERGAASGSGGFVGGATLTIGIKVTMDDLTDSGSEFDGDFQKFVDWVRAKGFGAIGFYAVDPTSEPDQVARFWFEDVTFADGTKLSDHGFAAGGKSLRELVQAARRANLGVQADLTRLALSLEDTSLAERPHAGDALTASQIGTLCAQLLTGTDVDSITARGFPPDWAAEAKRACEAADRLFFAGDYATIRRAETGSAAPLDLDRESLMRNELAMGRARLEPYQLWAGVTAERNYGRRSPFSSSWASLKEAESALIFRTVLSSPQGLFLDMPPSSVNKLSGGLLEKVKTYAAMRRPRPKCSVVILGDSTPRNITAIVNGIASAGYDIVVGTRPANQRDADAFYIIVTRNADGTMPDPAKSLPGDIYNLGKACFMQVCGPIPALGLSEGWDAVRRSFGLANADIPMLEQGPAEAVYAGTPVPCAESTEGPWGPALTPRVLTSAKPVVVASEGTFEEGAELPRDAVVVVSVFSYGSSGRNILVAGSELAPEMAYPISNLLAAGDGLQAPTRVLCSAGSPTAAFAAGEGGRVALRYKDGTETKTLDRELKSGEIVVIEVKQASAVGTMPLPDRPRE